jgi:Icc-related predicted phosphoesterase
MINILNDCKSLAVGLLIVWIFIFGCQSQDSKEKLQFARDDQIDLLKQTTRPLPWTHLELNNDPKNFQFIIVTDRTGGNRPGVFKQGIEKINLLQPEFVLSVGDLIDGYTEDPVIVKNQWNEFDAFVDDLDMPFFYVPGNHDITNKLMENMWKERYGSTFYYFVYRNVLFLCLNSEEALTAHVSTTFSEQQINFIKQTLETHKDVRWTCLFFHKPVWIAEEFGGNGEEILEKSGWNKIESLIKNRKYTVFAGHIHEYTHRIRQNRDYITLATMGGGSGLSGPVFGQFDHVMWVTMTDNGPVMANLMLDGIWDKDFSAEDIEKNLFLLINGKVVKTKTGVNEDKPLNNQQVELQLTNIRDLPMEVVLTFDRSKNLSLSPEKITKTVSPNSVSTVKLNLKLKNAGKWRDQSSRSEDDGDWERLMNELWNLRVHWEATYNFDRLGKITVNGSMEMF